MRILLFLSVVFAAAEARADCAIREWFGTPDGTKLPPSGVLFIHDEMLGYNDDAPSVEHRWIGQPGHLTVHRVEDAIARIEYVGFAGSTLVIKNRRDEEVKYPLVEEWSPYPRSPRVLTYWHQEMEWTCSWADSLIVQIDQPVAAIRARWSYEGRAVEWIEATQTERTKIVVELGKINCGGTTIQPDQLREGGELELFAIRFDGSEVAIRGMPKWISLAKMPTINAGVEGALTIVDGNDPPRAAPPKRYGRTLGAIVLAIFALGMVLAWRWRVRAPTVV